MKCLVYATRAGAENRSRTEAQRRNCGPVTTHWWEVVEGINGDFGVVILPRPGEEANLSSADRNRLNAAFVRKVLKEPSE